MKTPKEIAMKFEELVKCGKCPFKPCNSTDEQDCMEYWLKWIYDEVEI